MSLNLALFEGKSSEVRDCLSFLIDGLRADPSNRLSYTDSRFNL